MRINFPSVMNILRSLAAYFPFPTVNQKAGAGADVQADATGQDAADKESASSEEGYDFEAHRWVYRGRYRSIFPPMF